MWLIRVEIWTLTAFLLLLHGRIIPQDLDEGYVKGAHERVAFAWTLSKHRPLVTLIIFVQYKLGL